MKENEFKNKVISNNNEILENKKVNVLDIENNE
jgi:hypothetical protein